MERDNVDLKTMSIPKLFEKIFWPTLIGMICSACTAIIDGIFVGHALGAEALAAVNIASPLIMLSTGVGLLFGAGASVIASMQLSHGKIRAANINITQAFIVSSVLMVILIALAMIFSDGTARLFGSSAELIPLVKSYMFGFLPSLVLFMLQDLGLYIIRLDGTPSFVVHCTVIPTLINIVLDYVFIYPMKMGLFGAGLASGIASIVGGGMVLLYMWKYTRIINFTPLRLSIKSLKLTLRNVKNMIKIGSSSFLAQVSGSLMIIIGNYVFIRYLGTDGVAAFSVACYIFSIVALINHAISQSAQPIISFNYGSGNRRRTRKAFLVSILYAVEFGLLLTLLIVFFAPYLVALFLTPDTAAYEIAAKGIPLFASGFLFYALNMVWIGYFQSVERIKPAFIFTMLRGLVLMLASFILLPRLFGATGIWLAVPASELVTFLLMVIFLLATRKKNSLQNTTINQQ